jgi:hypothetical protein
MLDKMKPVAEGHQQNKRLEMVGWCSLIYHFDVLKESKRDHEHRRRPLRARNNAQKRMSAPGVHAEKRDISTT